MPASTKVSRVVVVLETLRRLIAATQKPISSASLEVTLHCAQTTFSGPQLLIHLHAPTTKKSVAQMALRR